MGLCDLCGVVVRDLDLDAVVGVPKVSVYGLV